ncbi:hypothetical protein WJX73_002685 [Symbiochloris irregularis]|uniref:GPI-anchor transamidase n=1 Tax=Symbiochloris irregularis TaxID=706552 RepID=A0AAW1NWB5_9CHLO
MRLTTDCSSIWAVIAATSPFWFNYRHAANALALYHTLKRLCVPDSHIILMLADDAACNSRSPQRPSVFYHPNHMLDLIEDDIQVDYRGNDVTVASFLEVLTGKHSPAVPRSKRIFPDDGSNVLVFATGHGGEDFLKFNDREDLTSQQLADALDNMHSSRRYNQVLLIVDTCQAASLFSKVVVPNVFSIGSSKAGESSYSHFPDMQLGVAVVDRFSFFLFEFLERVQPASRLTLQHLLNDLRQQPLSSTGDR